MTAFLNIAVSSEASRGVDEYANKFNLLEQFNEKDRVIARARVLALATCINVSTGGRMDGIERWGIAG